MQQSDVLECPVCLDQFREPKVLPCQHTYCRECLQQLIRSSEEEGRRGQVRCAECRQDHRVPPGGFPTNVGTQRMLNAVQLPNVPAPSAPVQRVPTRQPDRTSRTVTPSYVDITSDMYREHIQVEGQYLPHHRNYVTQSRPQSDANPNPQNNSHENDTRPVYIPSDGECSGRCCKSVVYGLRERIRNLLRRFLNDHYKEKHTKVITCILFLTLAFSRFVAGATKLGSGCDPERELAAYTFVKSIQGAIFWVAVLVLGYKGELGNAIKNLCFEVYIYVHTLFAAIWLIVGTSWCFGRYSTMVSECPHEQVFWDYHFINFILFLIALDWIITVLFFFYACYVMCETPDEAAEEIGQ